LCEPSTTLTTYQFNCCYARLILLQLSEELDMNAVPSGETGLYLMPVQLGEINLKRYRNEGVETLGSETDGQTNFRRPIHGVISALIFLTLGYCNGAQGTLV